MSEMSHTPTPWKLGPTGDTVDDANGLELLRMYEADGREEPTALPYRANAAFIVRACNSHEELLSALKRAREALKANEEITGTWELYQASPEMKAIHAAIAKAEGR